MVSCEQALIGFYSPELLIVERSLAARSCWDVAESHS